MSPFFDTRPAVSFELSPIKAMEMAAAKIPSAVSLAQGIPSFNAPAVIREFAHEKICQGLCDKYSLTGGLPELREEIASALQRDGLDYDPETEIIVTAGSIEGLNAALLQCTKPGDEVLIPSPSYPSYAAAVQIARCMPRFFPLDEDDNFDFQVEHIKRALSRRSKALLYCSPNNPTGTLFSEAKSRQLMELAERYDLSVIIDEVYKDFYYTSDRHFTPASIPQARSRVVRVCSFSKAFAMTGWRVGFMHGAAERMAQILKYHDALVTCAPVASQYAAIAALRFGEPYLREFCMQFKTRRDFTIEMLDQMSDVLDYQTPKATYFVFPRIKDSVPLARNSARLAYDILEKAKLALVAGSAFGPTGEAHLRINFGRSREDVETGMQRLAGYFAALRKTARKSKGKDSPATSTGSCEKKDSLPCPAAAFPDSRPKPFFRTVLQGVLSLCARVHLLRCRPVIIGICGSLGKTVVKRMVLEMLRSHLPARAGILSYNTEIGLPLSILGLQLPAGRTGKFKFLASLAGVALWKPDPVRVLILEYGIANQRDAKILRSIAKPDWLIITDIASSDPGFDCRAALDGIRTLAAGLSAENILWSGEDAWCKEVRPDLLGELALQLSTMDGGTLKTPQADYALRREFIGRSAKLAALAAVLLAERLGVPGQLINTFLADGN